VEVVGVANAYITEESRLESFISLQHIGYSYKKKAQAVASALRHLEKLTM
jgi:hypothetical protein